MADERPDAIEVEVISTPVQGNALDRLEPGAGYVAGGHGDRPLMREFERVSTDDLREGIERICAAVTAAMARVSPDACDVEFAVGFKAGARVPVLVSGEANASLKVVLHWKRQAGAVGNSS